jgi:hypothetical protein
VLGKNHLKKKPTIRLKLLRRPLFTNRETYIKCLKRTARKR